MEVLQCFFEGYDINGVLEFFNIDISILEEYISKEDVFDFCFFDIFVLVSLVFYFYGQFVMFGFSGVYYLSFFGGGFFLGCYGFFLFLGYGILLNCNNNNGMGVVFKFFLGGIGPPIKVEFKVFYVLGILLDFFLDLGFEVYFFQQVNEFYFLCMIIFEILCYVGVFFCLEYLFLFLVYLLGFLLFLLFLFYYFVLQWDLYMKVEFLIFYYVVMGQGLVFIDFYYIQQFQMLYQFLQQYGVEFFIYFFKKRKYFEFFFSIFNVQMLNGMIKQEFGIVIVLFLYFI